LSIKDGLAHPNKPALMYALQRSESVECLDILAGKSIFDLTLEEDFVLIKSDGYPTYHLAHIADDHDMKTTLVIRAKEWYPSLPKHVTMFKDIYNEAPEFLHLPVILGETGNKKMSKRDGNVNIQDYIDQGYLPEALLNYIAFLGWSPGTEKELYLSPSDFELDFSNEIDWELVLDNRIQTLLSNLVADFGIENISTASARFSKQKLDWFNKEYIKMMSLEEFAQRSSTFNMQSADINNLHSSDYLAALYLDTQRITTLSEIGKDSQSILNWKSPENEILKWKKITIEETKSCLAAVSQYVTTLYPKLESHQKSLIESVHNQDFEFQYRTLVETWEKDIKQWLQENNLDVGSHLWPLRVCLSGQAQSPSPFELLAILSQEEFEKRIETCI
jgi:glutamyl-tRNA synthetase